ncbi:MAG: hypothetical protein EBU08_17720 [Micrococcales bacterium]|nr:hypothetical protein [Micrococcales bacterium]
MNIVWNTIQEQAKAELDRLADLYKQASEQFNNSIGKIGEKENHSIAMDIFNQMETTKRAYAALGITGQVGVHYISKVGA